MPLSFNLIRQGHISHYEVKPVPKPSTSKIWETRRSSMRRRAITTDEHREGVESADIHNGPRFIVELAIHVYATWQPLFHDATRQQPSGGVPSREYQELGPESRFSA